MGQRRVRSRRSSPPSGCSPPSSSSSAGRPTRSRRWSCSPTPPPWVRMPVGCCWWPGSWGPSSSRPCSCRTSSATRRCRPGSGFLPLTAPLFLASQLSARRFVEQFGPRRVMVAGTLLSTTALLLLSRVSETSSYWSILLPLVLLGLGNGTAFVPLTGASLHEVEPQHAGAASGLVNVTQQVGGSLGLALLVTVFGTATRHAAAEPTPRPRRRRAGAPRLRRRRELRADRRGGLRAPDRAGRLAAAPDPTGQQVRPVCAPPWPPSPTRPATKQGMEPANCPVPCRDRR